MAKKFNQKEERESAKRIGMVGAREENQEKEKIVGAYPIATHRGELSDLANICLDGKIGHDTL